MGAAPSENVFVEAGVWPTSAVFLLPLSNVSMEGSAAELVETVRPGVLVGVRFN